MSEVFLSLSFSVWNFLFCLDGPQLYMGGSKMSQYGCGVSQSLDGLFGPFGRTPLATVQGVASTGQAYMENGIARVTPLF